ncbi:MAG: LUD domain-containing protein [Patescibacteria group bacterium]|nr:LUD domain-containing protein [Patescibacteria group bacterium]
MSSRETILQAIRSNLGGAGAAERPAVPEVWPRATSDTAALALRFANELQTVQGELIRCPSWEDAATTLVEIVDGSQWPTIAAVDGPLCRQATARLDRARVAWAVDDMQPASLAEIPAGLIEAQCLLADTGSCLVVNRTATERLMCYLPETCIVVATLDMLREHLPAAWEEIGERLREPSFRGELVMITGPSRTADIEKILILGVHGPKRLIVLLVG